MLSATLAKEAGNATRHHSPKVNHDHFKEFLDYEWWFLTIIIVNELDIVEVVTP